MRRSANPFGSLEPALRALAKAVDVLPATGQAQEYLQQFDTDEVYDRIRMADDRVVSRIMERPNNELYVQLEALPRQEDHVFRFFVDGSARTHFLGTLVLRDKSTPLVLAQIGAAAVRREADGRIFRHDLGEVFGSRMLFLLDGRMVPGGVFQSLESILSQTLVGSMRMGTVDTSKSDDYNNSRQLSTREPRSRTRHRANWEMRRLEIDLLRELLRNTADEQGWIVVDGGLGKEFRAWTERADFVGVVKNFSKDPIFQIGRGPRQATLNLYELLARLPVNHRTLAFAANDGLTVFWYVRIREQGVLDYPLMGVVKVELPDPKEQIQDSSLIDHLSAALIAERTVAPHGRDPRWHAHFYPISVAERVIKESFFSEEVLRAGIKWPRLRDLTGE